MQFPIIQLIGIFLIQLEQSINQCYLSFGLNEGQKNEIVNAHNQFRTKVARGEQKDQPSASNMRVISWDSALEQFANEYAKTCPLKNNPIKKTSSFLYVGENMYSTTNNTLNLTAIVEAWQNEVVYFNSSNINSFIGSTNPYYLNYTQLVWGRTSKIGCGLIQENVTKWTLVCNQWQQGNIEKSVMYEPGIPCSTCPNDCQPLGTLCNFMPSITLTGLLSPAMNYILSEHNNIRAKVALGEEPGLPQAANMKEMVWDGKMALSTQFYANTAIEVKNYNARDSNNELIGENLFLFPGKDLVAQPDPDTIAKMALEYWKSFSSSITYAMISQPNQQISSNKMQQLQMIYWNATKIGCGYAFTNYKDHIFVCNYYSPLKLTENIYKIGQNRRDCQLTQSTGNKGLCSTYEIQTIQLTFPQEPLQRIPSIVCNSPTLRYYPQLDICISLRCRIANCQYCQANESSCERCANGYKLENGGCKPTQCPSNCVICLSDNYCDICEKGFQKDKGFCLKCLGNCSRCISQNTSQCTECLENETLKPFNSYSGIFGKCEEINKSDNIAALIKTVNKNTFQTNPSTTSQLATYFLSWLQQNSTQALNNSSIIDMYIAYLNAYTTFLAENELSYNNLAAILTTFNSMDALCEAGRTQNKSLINYQKKCSSMLQGIKSTDFVEKVQVKDIFNLVGKSASIKNLTNDIKSDIQKSQITSRKALWNLTNKADIDQTENSENISMLLKIKHAKPKKKENGSGAYLASNISDSSSIFVDISTKTINATNDIVIEAVELDEEIAQGMLPNSSNLELVKFKVLEINALNSNQENIIPENQQIMNKLHFAIPKEIIPKLNNSKWACIQIESENPLEWKKLSNNVSLLQNNVIECMANHFSYQTVVVDTGFDIETSSNKTLIIIVGSISAVVFIIVIVFVYFAWKRRRKSKEQMRLAEKMGIGLK